MRRFAPPVPRRASSFACLLLGLMALWGVGTSQVAAQQKTYVDPNVNMVKGTVWPLGDPYLQRQNEPSIAVSTRNPCHLVAGANDYRSVDVPFDDTVPPNSENSLSLAGDAWLGLFKSFDCGAKWQSTLLPGYPQDMSSLAPELKGHAAGADPTVRAGTNGLFYYSGMVFNRGTQGTSKIFVSRLIDNNDKERGDPIQFLDVSIIDTGTKGQFLDKPWMAVDVPRTGFGPGSKLGGSATCSVNGQTLPAGNVYMAWAKFTGNGNQHSKLMFAKSSDCGKTFKQHPISSNQSLSQGANLAVAPHDGTLYLTWREFAGNGSNKTVNFWIVTSSDGGDSWTAARKIGSSVSTFDQLRSISTFRSNALPAITADHQNRVYVAWSARGAANYVDANGLLKSSNDARIMMVASSDRGKTWSSPFPIDPVAARGHQLMPSLTFAAGRIQAIWYDAREDVAGVWGQYIDDAQATGLLHTIDVRGAQATPAPQPVFVAASELSQEISRYRTWNVEVAGAPGTPNTNRSVEIGSNPPNLPMYANGTTPFIGDYIDVSGLPSFPVQTASGQIWQPNIGALNLGTDAGNVSTSGFPTLASFHATWTDNRDVNISQCAAAPPGQQQQMVGQRNANIYTARLTQGLYVGSPGNTKPFGKNPGKPSELIQRGFVVFAQNTTDTLKFFRFKIETQPVGGRASLKQFDHNGPLTEVIVSVPAASTVARTVYATSTDETAQLMINIEQMVHDAGTIVVDNGVSKKNFVWSIVANGLRGSVLLNPDRTNPPIQNPDVDSDVPEIATDEVHNPSMFDAQFFKRRTKSNKLDVLNARVPDPENPDPENPDPENPDPENPDPENPDPENPDPENPDPENPDPENPDPENPDPENPDPENPDPENLSLVNATISDIELQNATITDIQWKVHNSGNTTSAYKFRPSLPKTSGDQRYQLIVTRRSMALALGADCKPVYKSANQVLANIVNFQPRTPDPENPDIENPDPENPDPENPDPENPDPENANFFLPPDETATVTLRVFDLDPTTGEAPPETRAEVAAKTAAQAANTGQTTVSTAVAGPDLTLFDVPAAVAPAISRPGKTATVTFTLSNRGTGPATAALIATKVYLSADQTVGLGDTLLATIVEPSPFGHCLGEELDLGCSTSSSVNVTVPAVAGTSYVIIVTDPDESVFEADELNNQVVVPIVVANYQLSFATQPPSTTQDFTMTPAVVVNVTHPDNGVVTAADVPGVTLAIVSNPAAGALAGTLFKPTGTTSFADLKINNAGNGYTLSASAPLATGATSAVFNIEADLAPVVANDIHTTNEEQVLQPAAPGVLGNDSDPATKGTKPASYTFHAEQVTDPSNGTVTVNADGSFSYAPAANFAGSDSFTYRAKDGRPGNQTTGTVSITVANINDVPSFTKGADQVALEDSGAQSVPGWATAISAGPANEASQSVDFIVSNNNNALFSSQPTVTPNGTLTYTSAANASGVASVTVRIHDSGGIANGGVDTSAPQTFTISITGDNDPPGAAADSYSTNEDASFGVDAGNPVNGRYLNGLLANDTDPEGDLLVVEYLTTTSNGVLSPHGNGSFSYAPNPNFFGTDSFTYRAFDGTTTGNTVTVTFTVESVNDVPSFTKGANQSVPENSGAQTMANWATAISKGAANESAQTLTFIVSNDNGQLFSVAPAISAAGTLTFTPRANRQGVASITVQLRDNGGIANGGVDVSAAQTFTISVTNAATTLVVTNTNDSGAGSLRQAIINANANASADTITFNIPGAGVRTITPLTALPQILFPVVINATTQPGFAGTPLVELNGASAGASGVGFNVFAQNVTIRGFIVNRFQQIGISLNTANNTVVGNYIGTDGTGTTALGNFLGVFASVGPNLIGGSTAADRNVISGNTNTGLQIQKYTTPGVSVKGNYIGTNAAGTAAVPNAARGIYLDSVAAAQIGGDAAGEGNVISGNGGHGVDIFGCEWISACGALIAGNRIGTNADGTAAVSNSGAGIYVNRSGNTVIRGNVISGNGYGPRPTAFHGSGISIASENVAVDPQAELNYGNHLVVGNKIGTDLSGMSPVPNEFFGVVLSNPTKATIGGPLASDRNVIAYNGDAAVHVGYARSDNNLIQGNYLGVNLGLQPAGNDGAGVFITNGSSGNTISGNVIGANVNGVAMNYGQQNGNTITGNFIGTDSAGTLNLGNTGHGVTVAGNNNVISQNRIVNNAGVGVWVVLANQVAGPQSIGNRLSQNYLFNNGQLGIDLDVSGVTANDPGDGDTGPNNGQNFPLITSAFINGGVATILGSLNSAPSSTYTIEFFSSAAADSSGYGEGQNYLGSLAVTTDASGNAGISTTFTGVSAGNLVTATAADADGNTSEFSLARVVVANSPPSATSDDILTLNDLAMTSFPAANDTDPDVASPSVRATYAPFTGLVAPLVSPGDVAIVSGTGRAYFTGGNLSAATDGRIGVLDLASNTLSSAIQMQGNVGANLTRVNQSTQIVYMRAANALQAIDARIGSPTINTSILNINLGTINSMVIDETRQRLYLTTVTSGPRLLNSGRLTVLDIDPSSANFHKVIAELSMPGTNTSAGSLAVNPVTNRIYVGYGSSPSNGILVVNGATFTASPVAGLSSNPTSMVVNDASNLVFAITGSNLLIIDGADNHTFATRALPASAGSGGLDTRLAVHRGTGLVYVRLAEFPNPSRLIVFDGQRSSPTYLTVRSALQMTPGRENGPTQVAIDEVANRLITTSTSDLKSSVIDTDTHQIIGTIQSTQSVVRASIDLQTHRAYAAGGIGLIQVIDLAGGTLVATIPVGVELVGVAVDPITHSAYVSQTGVATGLVRVNESGLIGTVPLPHGDGRELFAVRNSVTNRLYVLNGGATAAGGSEALPGFVQVINGADNTVIASVPVGAFPFGLAVDEAGNKIYVGNATSSTFAGGISIIDGGTHLVTQANVSAIPSLNNPPSITVGRDMVPAGTGKLYFRVTGGGVSQLAVLNGTVAAALPNFGNVNIIRFSPITNKVYVGATLPGSSTNQVHILDGATNQLLASLTVGSPTNFVTNQSYIASHAGTGRVFIADFENNQLVVVDGNSNNVTATIPVGWGPSTVAVNQTANRIYVGNAVDRTLTIIDGATLRVVRTLSLPIAPVKLDVDDSLSPARIYALSTANQGKVSVIDDPGTSAPQLTSVTQGAHGTVVLNTNGSVTYTPNAGYTGADSYTYTTADDLGATTTSTAHVTVLPRLTITTPSVLDTTVGSSYFLTLASSGGTGGKTWSVLSGPLPGGIGLSSSGVLSGLPAQSGNFTFSVRVRDAGMPAQSADMTYTLIVGPMVMGPLTISSGIVNLPYSQQLFAAGAKGDVTWSLNTNGHPGLNWLSVSNTGVLSGTPVEYGTTPSFTVTATDSSTPVAQTASRTYTSSISGPLTMAPLREGTVLETQPSVTFLGGTGTRSLAITGGALPPGIVLGTGGVFTGTPQRHGTYNFTLELRDSGTPQQVVPKSITWQVSAREQQGNQNTGSGTTIAVGSTTGRRVAQVFTVGAEGTLTGIGLSGLTCPVTQTTVTVDLQRLTVDGVPDGTTIASGSAQANFLAIKIAPEIAVAIGERYAFVVGVNGPLSCSFANTSNLDLYNAGDAYASTGGAWTRLSATADAAYDVPSFRTMIQPAMDVSYLPSSHGGNTATLLNNGKVLIVGQSTSRNASLYDPATNLTTATGQTTMVRQNATATLLGDGTVLITGGRDENSNRNAQAEIYDPVSGTFSPTNGNMANARDNHRAVRFVHGGVEKILITGGQNSLNTTLAAVEVYDPVAKTFTVLANNLLARQSHAAVLLNNGRILVAGGYTNGSGAMAELFDPATNTFTATGNMVVSNRGLATATLLNDGRVLIAGGQSGDVRNEAEIYDPATGLFAATSSMLSPRYNHTATLLADGSVVISGGSAEQNLGNYTLPLATMERFIPAPGTFISAGSMETRRGSHASVRLASNKVLSVGGFSQSWMTGNTAEVYDPSTSPYLTPTSFATVTPNAAFSTVFNGHGGTGEPFTFALVGGRLPPGLSFNAGTVAGTPTTAGIYQFAVKVTDGTGNSNVQSLSMTVGSVNTITSPYRLPDAPQGNPYTYQLSATGPNPVTWSLLPNTSTTSSNPLPAGINLSSSGLLSGTPTTTNYYNFGVRAIDGLGVEAIKVLSISVPSPLSITTTTLGNPELFNSLSCINTSNGTGTKTYSIVSGALPAGVTFNGTTMSSCVSFSGVAKETGPFTFRVRITDSSFIPQAAEQTYTISVYAADQQMFSSGTPALSFGSGTGTRFAETVITGVTGTLRGIRIPNLSCTANPTSVNLQIQGLDAAGRPNGFVLATGSGLASVGTVYLSAGVFLVADQPFAVVFDADASCTLRPSTFDSYPGEGFISNGGGNWEPLTTLAPARHDMQFVSLVEPVSGWIPLAVQRSRHTETVLADGRVLIAGGCCGTAAEIYDPVTNTSTPTGNMTSVRYNHTATLLPNNKVLLAGGRSTSAYLASAELFDPATNLFAATPGAMSSAREHSRATALADGNVLITGGYSGSGFGLETAERYNWASNSFSTLPNMSRARYNHTATRLNDGHVLLTAGYGNGSGVSAELYDPNLGTFSATGNMTIPRARHTASLLPSGKVLLTGGVGPVGEALASTETYDPAAGAGGSFAAASPLSVPRLDHTAVTLGDASVLIAGGYSDTSCCSPKPSTATGQRYIEGTGFVNAAPMIVSRYGHSSELLGNGKVLVTGSQSPTSGAQRLSELFDPAAPYLEVTETTGNSGAPLNFTLQPAGGSGSGYMMSGLNGSLPLGGVALDFNTGQLTGTPAQSGTFRIGIEIVDGAGRKAYQLFTLRIDPITIATTTLPQAYQGAAYSAPLSGSGIPNITWTVSGGALPAGLTLNSDTGVLSGTPTGCCFFQFTIKATDGIGQSTTRGFSLSVTQPLQISTTSLGDGFAGSTYFGGLFAFNGTQPYNWSISGQPMGLTVNSSTGQFNVNWPSDVIRQAGSFTIQAQVVDSGSTQQTATRNLPLNIYAQDQSPSSNNTADITIPSSRRFAQVFQSSSPYALRGIQPWSLGCDPNVTLTGRVFPVTPGLMPDESGGPLGTGSLATSAAGFFMAGSLIFDSPVAMPQGTRFAVVFSATGDCRVMNWPVTDYYARGDAWISDNNGAWTLTSAVVGRYDLPITTLVMPPSSLRFLAGYRQGHATAKLNDGRVLLVGQDQYTEVYDPSTNLLATTANMSHARQNATATVLQSGKVLVAGGSYTFFDAGTQTWMAATAMTTQLFNPTTGQFEASQNMTVGRHSHAATLLANGNVLITGGQDANWQALQSAELFDGNGNHLASLNMTGARTEHTSTLLPDGRVAIIGGWGGAASTAEIYNPNTGSFGAAGNAATWPSQHTATLLTTGPRAGQVLVAGGQGGYPNLGDSYFFDPLLPGFASAPNLLTKRLDHTATALPNGLIIFTGGATDWVNWTGTAAVEIYDPVTDDRVTLSSLITDRQTHVADLVTTPTGPRLAISGGWGSSAMAPRTIELLDFDGALGSFAAAAPMTRTRRGHVAVQLDNGTVLLAGSDELGVNSAEIYNPATNNTAATGNLLTARCYGCAYTKLPDGKVLITGGWNGGPVFSSGEIYNPGSGSFSATGNMTAPRLEHSSVLLDNGKVLLLGGYDGTSTYASAELYDPVTDTFASTGSMASVRYRATATKLQNGKVLVVGGLVTGSNSIVTTAELYDPVTGTFSATGSMVTPRYTEVPVLLSDGRVLVAGGASGVVLASAEVYNPLTGSWSVVGSMTTPRIGHFAVKLPNGVVVVGGGESASVFLDTAEMFNPTTNTFSRIANLPSAIANVKAMLLGDGRIMMTGGTTAAGRADVVGYYVP